MDFDRLALDTRNAFLSGSLHEPLRERLAQLQQENMLTLNIKLDEDLSVAFNALRIPPSRITPEMILLAQIIRNQTGPRETPKPVVVEPAVTVGVNPPATE